MWCPRVAAGIGSAAPPSALKQRQFRMKDGHELGVRVARETLAGFPRGAGQLEAIGVKARLARGDEMTFATQTIEPGGRRFARCWPRRAQFNETVDRAPGAALPQSDL